MDYPNALKKEGDAFFAQKRYSEAYDIYAKAIKVDATNAVLYCNRSACSFALGRYFDASSDARKATGLNPNYVKAWGRRAAADKELGLWSGVAECYEKALKLLSEKSELTEAEKSQKRNYEGGLVLAKENLKPLHPKSTLVPASHEGQRPWDRAKEIVESFGKAGEATFTVNRDSISSAHVIYEAYLEFSEASANVQNVKMIPEGDQIRLITTGKALEGLSNAIMRDRRVFHISDPKWFEKYDVQARAECEGTGAWVDAGPDDVLSQAQDRVRNSGWDKARPAISVTVRAWILKGFFTHSVAQHAAAATHFYMNAIDLLERGRKIWADVPRETRGSVFEETFIIGVRALHLVTFFHASAELREKDSRFSNEALQSLASALAQDVLALSQRAGNVFHDQGFLLSFIHYPLGEAYATLGYCAKVDAVAPDKTPEERALYFGNSAQAYIKATQAFPDDEEYHCQHLSHAASSWWEFDDVPINTVRPILAQLKKALPKMRNIWESSAVGIEGLGQELDKHIEFYDAVEARLQAGELTEDQTWPQDLRNILRFNQT